MATGDFPSDLITAKNQQSQLDILEKSFRELFEPRLAVSVARNLIVANHPGRELLLSSPTHVGRAQIFVVPRKSYLFITVAERKNFDDELASRFFQSIRIILD